MSLRRPPAPPPKSNPPSVELLRAIGAPSSNSCGAPIADLDDLATESGIVLVKLWPLVEVGVRAGYSDADEDGTISLTARGWAWWRTRYASAYAAALASDGVGPQFTSLALLR